MTLHVTGFSTGTDKEGVPTAVPTQVMTKDLPTADDVMSYIRSYNRTLPQGKAFMFTVTGTPDAVKENEKAHAPASEPVTDTPISDDDAQTIAAMCCFDYALNNIGCQLTGLLSTESLTSWLDDDIYDSLVDAQNRIVRALEWMEGNDEAGADATPTVEEGNVAEAVE